MAFLRSVSSLRSAAALRPTLAAPRLTLAFAARSYAHSGYGDGKGDPTAENPQTQPPAKSRDLEHPGPPPPDVGKGTDASASKPEGSGGSSSSSSKTSGSGGGAQKSQGDRSVKGAQPKILNDNPPSENDPEVKQHNKEMEQRAERAETKVSNKDAEKDKVPPSFWSGQGGTKGG